MEDLRIPSYADTMSEMSTGTHGTSLLADSLRHVDRMSPSTSTAPPPITSSRRRKGKSRERTVPIGAVVFNPVDPLTQDGLVDPVLANDGLIHDRMAVINGSMRNVKNPDEVSLFCQEADY